MRKEIIINATANEIRIAITEDKRLAELYVETPEKERMVGDIYLGKVAKVMPGIRAAFIDLGLKQDAFLHFSDIGSTLGEYSSLIGDEDSDVDTEDGDDDESSSSSESSESASSRQGSSNTAVAAPPVQAPPAAAPAAPSRGSRDSKWRDSLPDLKRGQEIIVQITKEPV